MKSIFTLLLAVLGILVGINAQIPTDGLVAHYPFDGNANDESGNGNDGTVYGATLTTDRFGNENSAYSFNGIDNRIFIGNSLLAEGYNISISCWFKANNSVGQIISTGNRNSYNIGVGTERINSGLYLSDNADGHGSTAEITFDESYEWTHVVVTYDGTNHKLYRNGELVDNQIAEGAVFSNQAVYLNIGVYQYFGSNYSAWFSGLIDDVRLYNQTITENEIQALYQEGGWSSLKDGLVSYYPFNGNANDESWNGNDGIVDGATFTTDRNGIANNALYFDGTDDYVKIAGALPITNTFTISFWTNYESGSGYNNIICDGSSSAGGADFLINFRDNNIGIRADKDAPLNYEDGSPEELSGLDIVNKWVHVVWVMNPSSSKIYLNNNLIATINEAGTNEGYHDEYSFIGARQVWGSPDYFFQGKIDDVAIYNRELSDSEINTLYSADGMASETITDIDGNIYTTVKIGNQTWMAENLKTTTYNDGTPIPNVTDNTEWSNLTTGAYCWYDNDEASYKDTYGALYNWYTVETGNLCPSGWHVPTYTEWLVMESFLGDIDVGGKLKEAGTAHWLSPNTGATNESGFTALPAGARGTNPADFIYLSELGIWWTSMTTIDDYTSYYNPQVRYDDSRRLGYAGVTKGIGMSIRCLKDSEATNSWSIDVQDATADEGQIVEIPISVSELTSGDNIISYQFDIDYDNTVLEYVNADLTGTLADGGTTSINSDVSGKLNVSYMTSTAIVGAGDILLLQFNTLKADTTEVTISNAYLNATEVTDLTAGQVIIKDVTPPTAEISYDDTENRCGDDLFITATFSEPMLDGIPVKISMSDGATLTASDMTRVSPTVYTYSFVIPNSTGDVTISLLNGTDLWGNEITATPTSGETFSIIPINYGDVDDNGVVMAYDAALTLQHSVGIDPLPLVDPLPWENWRDTTANVDRTAGITANDAGLILQYSTGKITDFTSTKKSVMQGFVSIQFIDYKIVFLSYGDLIGLNVSADNENQILGEPVVLADDFMLAKNIKGSTYRIGICTSSSPADGTQLMEIPVLNDGQITIDMVVNNDLYSMDLNLLTDIESSVEDRFMLYPNPAKDVINISGILTRTIASIYDINGKLVISKEISSTESEISVSELISGMYVIKLQEDNQVYVKRFVIE
jgi:uncharacterized protein (TIGR02145 family)